MLQSPRVLVPVGNINVKSPLLPWFKTTQGDVGSWREVALQRAGVVNFDFLGIGNDLLTNLGPEPARDWKIENYPGGIRISPEVDATGTLYDPLWRRLTSGCSPATVPANPTRAQVSALVDADCQGVEVAGDLTLNGSWGSYSGLPMVVFVAGDLTASQNFTLGADTGIIFVVKGDINIRSSVTRLDGVFIAGGTFRSSDAPCGGTASTSQLVINGAVLVFGPGELCLTRALANNTPPAELVNFEPKYLWLFREVIGESRSVYNEVAP
jgi:hypothetical protein